MRLSRPAFPNARSLALYTALQDRVAALDLPLHVVLGGDGTMLHCIHQHGGEGNFFGVNCGTLGFLMNDIPGEVDEVAEQVLRVLQQKSWKALDFPCLQLHAEGPDGAIEDFAVNDVYIARETGQTVHLRVVVDGVEVVNRLICDGLIAATPLGSTAYSFSAGGPAAHPLVEALQLTAICPHSPRLSPMVLPLGTRVEVEVESPDRRPARVSVDGQDRGRVRRLGVSLSSRRVTLCFLQEHDFTATLVRKILHA
ncbi:MAG TPA: NAD(+)/NADH kinase [Myxococcota bacterium]|nr:NAD(+)/NADH kinase [Myxococcota bacterium]